MITFTLVADFFSRCINFHLEKCCAFFQRTFFRCALLPNAISFVCTNTASPLADFEITSSNSRQRQRLQRKQHDRKNKTNMDGLKIKTHWFVRIKTGRKMRRRWKRNGRRRVFCGVHSFLCMWWDKQDAYDVCMCVHRVDCMCMSAYLFSCECVYTNYVYINDRDGPTTTWNRFNNAKLDFQKQEFEFIMNNIPRCCCS